MSKLVSQGVFPVHNNKFEVETADSTYSTIAELENFSPAFDNTIEEWYSMDNEGWASALLTGKKWGLTLSGKRCIGNVGQDYLVDKQFSIGQDAYANFKWTMPSGTVITQQMVVSVTNNGGGDTTNVAPFEIELTSNGKPTVTTTTMEG